MKQKSTRITERLGLQVIEHIIAGAFDEKEAAIEQQRFDFSVQVYEDLYDDSTRKEMEALPNGWLVESDTFNVQFGATSSGYCRRNLQKKKRFLAKHKESHSQCLKVYEESHPLAVAHDNLTKAQESLKEEKYRAIASAKSLVFSCRTTKQLKELWPEIKKYIEPYESVEERTTTALAPITTELNKILGLV